MIPAFSSVTTLSSSLVDDIRNCSEAGCRHLELWFTKLEELLEKGTRYSSLPALKELLAEKKVNIVAAAFQGGLLQLAKEKRQAQFELFQKRLTYCQELNIPVMILVGDTMDSFNSEVLGHIHAQLAMAAELASSFEVKLAFEFQSSSRWCTCLSTAMEMIQMVGSPNLGICLDMIHYYTGPSKPEDLLSLTAENLFAVQLCDLSGTSREFARDADRILPGEGDFHLAHVLQHLNSMGYGGYVTAELLNPVLWQMKPKEVVNAAYQSITRLLRPGTLADHGPSRILS